MDSLNTSLLQHDHLSSVRRKDKILVIGFFSLIILLALIIGGMLISLVQKINSESLDSTRVLREFCFPFDSQSSCITFLASEIKPPSNTNPNQILLLSLEASIKKLTYIIPIVSDGTRPEHAFGNCSSSLGHATGQLNNLLKMTRLGYSQSGKMTAWITAAAEDLAACVSDLGKAERTAADGVRMKVVEVAALVGYSKGFIVNWKIVHENFQFDLRNVRSSRGEIVENLITVSLVGLQYFVLVFLFCLLLRIY